MSKRELAPWRGELPPVPNLYEIPDDLFFAIESTEHPGSIITRHYQPRVIERAKDHLKALGPYLAPVTREVVTMWVAPILLVAPNQRDPRLMPKWTDALMLAMADVPVGAFSVRNQKAALRSITFFPTPADIWNVISDDVRVLRTRESTLRRIIGD